MRLIHRFITGVKDAVDHAGDVLDDADDVVLQAAKKVVETSGAGRAEAKRVLIAAALGMGETLDQATTQAALLVRDADKSNVELKQVLLRLEGDNPNSITEGYRGGIDGDHGDMTAAAEDSVAEEMGGESEVVLLAEIAELASAPTQG